MNHLKSMLLLAKVLDSGSMSTVAKALGMSPSAVSQHLRQLERHYNLKLLNRTTRQISPTAAGQIVWRGAKQILDSLADTDEKLEQLQTEFSGEVVICLPSGFLECSQIQDFIQKVSQRYRHIQLTLLPDDNVINLLDGKVDIAIRATEPLPDGHLIARYLTAWKLCICASPRYLDAHPIEKVGDLPNQKWIKYQENVFNNAFNSLGLGHFAAQSVIYCPAIAAARSLALTDNGLTFQLYGEVEHYLQQGDLTLVLPECPLPLYNIYAVTAHRTQSAKIEFVLKLLKACFSNA